MPNKSFLGEIVSELEGKADKVHQHVEADITDLSRLRYRGDWSDNAEYKVNDLVVFQKIMYVCVADNAKKVPLDKSYWEAFLRGVEGERGAKGEKGDPGIGVTGKPGRDGTNGRDGINGKDGQDAETLPKGGQEGQILAKRTDKDFDLMWVNKPANGVEGPQGAQGPAGADGGSGSAAGRGTFTNSDLTGGVLTITHDKGLGAPYSVLIQIFTNEGKIIIPDEVTGLANTVRVDLTSWGAITGTWGYIYV